MERFSRNQARQNASWVRPQKAIPQPQRRHSIQRRRFAWGHSLGAKHGEIQVNKNLFCPCDILKLGEKWSKRRQYRNQPRNVQNSSLSTCRSSTPRPTTMLGG